MIFKHMSLEEAQAFYKELKEASKCGCFPLVKIAMDDIWFFTRGLTKDYGKSKNKTNADDASKYIQLSIDI